MKLSDAYRVVKDSIRNNTPVMLWGPPGIGKSSLVHQIAAEMGREVLDLRLAQLEPTDLRGIPMPNHETGRADWFLPGFWPQRSKEDTTRQVERVDEQGNRTVETVVVKAGNCPHGPGIVFLDEIEKAPISVKNASLQLVLDRAIGTYQLPNDWAMVCAGNREEDGCFSAPLGAALSNRMIHLDCDADVEAWAMWARDNGNVADDIIGFLHFKPELLYKQTEEHAFPTPRSWVMASSLAANCKTTKEQKELIGAAVGKSAAQEFTVWQNVYKNVDPERVFSGEMPVFDGKDQSYKYAVALAVAFALRKRKGGIKKAEEHVAKFLEILTPELRVIVLRQLSLPMMESMAKHPAFKQRVSEIMKIAV